MDDGATAVLCRPHGPRRTPDWISPRRVPRLRFHDRPGKPNALQQVLQIRHDGQITFGLAESCQVPRLKIFCFTEAANQVHKLAPARATMRGRFAVVTNVGAGCDGRCGVRRDHSCPTKRWQRTAKSCGPGAATLASISAGPCQRGNGGKTGRSPGRARISRKAIARGKPGCLGCTCQTRVHSL